jgi:hypothetical protein
MFVCFGTVLPGGRKPIGAVSGLVGVKVTVPNVPNMRDMHGWAVPSRLNSVFVDVITEHIRRPHSTGLESESADPAEVVVSPFRAHDG